MILRYITARASFDLLLSIENSNRLISESTWLKFVSRLPISYKIDAVAAEFLYQLEDPTLTKGIDFRRFLKLCALLCERVVVSTTIKVKFVENSLTLRQKLKIDSEDGFQDQNITFGFSAEINSNPMLKPGIDGVVPDVASRDSSAIISRVDWSKRSSHAGAGSDLDYYNGKIDELRRNRLIAMAKYLNELTITIKDWAIIPVMVCKLIL